MPGPVSRWQRNGGGIIRRQRTRLLVELPDEDLVQAQVRVQHESAGRIGLNHMRVRSIMSAEGEAARRSVSCLGRANLASIILDIGGFSQATTLKNRQHSDGAAKIVCHQ